MTSLRALLRGTLDRYDRRDEREFLPAALEVIETPPSPTGRALGLLIILLFACALIWSIFGKVDILATAPGRLLPKGDVKVIQSLDIGSVRAIHVQDGDHVRAGEVLIELDPTQAGADKTRAAGDLLQARLDVARLTALRVAATSGLAPLFVPPAGAPPALVEQARAAMVAQADEEAAKLADIGQQINQKAAEQDEVAAEIAKARADIPLLDDKERIHRELTQEGFGTSLSYLDAQQEASAARHEVDVEAGKASEMKAARRALEQQRDTLRSAYLTGLLEELRKAQLQVNELSQDFSKASNRSSQTEMRSPIDGVVDQLAVHTLYGVVTPAQHLMIVVPDNRGLTIEARLSNADVGFVRAGQPVKVKVETYDFARYGLIDGHVIDVSHDVIDQELEHPAAIEGQAEGDAHRPSPSYVARIALDQSSMMIDGMRQPLLPGMAITAEIKTGRRSILSYLLSPIARRTQESLHER
jgi:hemolysin D